jgi:hypothetical protein
MPDSVAREARRYRGLVWRIALGVAIGNLSTLLVLLLLRCGSVYSP